MSDALDDAVHPVTYFMLQMCSRFLTKCSLYSNSRGNPAGELHAGELYFATIIKSYGLLIVSIVHVLFPNFYVSVVSQLGRDGSPISIGLIKAIRSNLHFCRPATTNSFVFTNEPGNKSAKSRRGTYKACANNNGNR